MQFNEVQCLQFCSNQAGMTDGTQLDRHVFMKQFSIFFTKTKVVEGSQQKGRRRFIHHHSRLEIINILVEPAR